MRLKECVKLAVIVWVWCCVAHGHAGTYYSYPAAPAYIEQQFGPFGPQDQTYSVPAGAIFAAPDGSDSNSGTSTNSPLTLKKAIETAPSGSVVVLRGGIYRTGDIYFSTQITIQPYLDEDPIIKGSRVANNWVQDGAHWVTSWTALFKSSVPSWHNNAWGDPCIWYGDTVFKDEKALYPVMNRSELNSGKYYIDYTNQLVYIADNPAGSTLEITAYKDGLVREHNTTSDVQGPTYLGLTVMHYVNKGVSMGGEKPSEPVDLSYIPDAPVNTRFEHCRLLACGNQNAGGVSPGSYFGYCEFARSINGAMKLDTSHDTIMEHNIIAENNVWGVGGYRGGIKNFNQSQRVIMRNNYIYNNKGEALWYDVGHRDGVVVNNYFKDNSKGLVVEISHGAVIAGNVFDDNGIGLLVHHDANDKIYNNTFHADQLLFIRANRGAGDDKFGWHPSSGPGVENYDGHHIVNNVFTGSNGSNPHINMEDENTYTDIFQVELFAHNLFLKERTTLIACEFEYEGWPYVSYSSLADFRARYGAYETGSAELNISSGQLYLDSSVGDFRLKNQPGIPAGVSLPQEIADLLGRSSTDPFLGALPPGDHVPPSWNSDPVVKANAKTGEVYSDSILYDVQVLYGVPLSFIKTEGR